MTTIKKEDLDAAALEIAGQVLKREEELAAHKAKRIAAFNEPRRKSRGRVIHEYKGNITPLNPNGAPL